MLLLQLFSHLLLGPVLLLLLEGMPDGVLLHVLVHLLAEGLLLLHLLELHFLDGHGLSNLSLSLLKLSDVSLILLLCNSLLHGLSVFFLLYHVSELDLLLHLPHLLAHLLLLEVGLLGVLFEHLSDLRLLGDLLFLDLLLHSLQLLNHLQLLELAVLLKVGNHLLLLLLGL